MYVVMNRERVRQLRQEKGLSKRGLAATAGISVATAKNVEREKPVLFSTGRKVAEALGVELSPSLGRVLARAYDHKEEHMGETITMAEILYVPVDDPGEPYRWGPEDEVTVSAFGDFWRAKMSPEGKGKAIRALALDDLQDSCAAGGAT